MSSSSDSRSNSSSSSKSSRSTPKNKKKKASKKVVEPAPRPKVPFYEKKQVLRNQLEIYQVDEDFEEESYTVTGQTAEDVCLPNIREQRRNKAKSVTKTQLQLPNKLAESNLSFSTSGFQPRFDSTLRQKQEIHQKYHEQRSTVNRSVNNKFEGVYTIQNSTSFFLQALEAQKAVLEEKKTSSPFMPKEAPSLPKPQAPRKPSRSSARD